MDDLKQLLAKADAPARPVRTDLARVVRQVVLRRRRRRRAVVASFAVLVLGGVAIALLMPRPHVTTHSVAVASVEVEELRQEIAELKSQASFHEQIVRAIENARSRDEQEEASRHELSQPDYLVQPDQQRQVAAQLMLAYAEQLSADPQKHEEATAHYRKVVALFPDTLASRAANDRLHGAGT